MAQDLPAKPKIDDPYFYIYNFPPAEIPTGQTRRSDDTRKILDKYIDAFVPAKRLAEKARRKADRALQVARRDWLEPRVAYLREQLHEVEVAEAKTRKFCRERDEAAARRKQERAAWEASQPEPKTFLSIMGYVQRPTIRRTTTTSSSNKRKATEENAQPPKRVKTSASTNTSACAPRQPPPHRSATLASSGRGVRPGPRKEKQTPDNSRRVKESRVSKPAHPPQASTRSASVKVNTSAMEGAIDGRRKKSTPDPPNSESSKVNQSDGQTPSTVEASNKTDYSTTSRSGSNISSTSKTSKKSKASSRTTEDESLKSAVSGGATQVSESASNGSSGITDDTADNNYAPHIYTNRLRRSTRRSREISRDTEQTQSRKRRASDDSNNEDRSMKKQKTESQVNEPTGLQEDFKACFSRVIIHLLDAAFDGHDLNTLFGDSTEFEPFNSDDADKLEDIITAAVAAGETDNVSVAKHLRKLLGDMHAAYVAQTNKVPSATLFQHIVAYGVLKDVNRKAMNGRIQQDAPEYYLMVVGILLKDPLVDGYAFTAQFEIDTATYDYCETCKYRTESRTATKYYHNVNIPKEDDDGFASGFDPIHSLLDQSMYSDADISCVNCKHSKLRSRTSFKKIPENLIVKLNRSSVLDYGPHKVETAVQFGRVIHLGEAGRYELAAVVMHKGQTIDGGHYTIYRRHGNNWFLIDDADVTRIDYEEMEDSVAEYGQGHSAIMLFKRDRTVFMS